jgi:menaquinone reductase, multiheme cytochrome c subunit
MPRRSLLAALVLACVMLLDGQALPGAPAVEQPILFNHKLHVDNGASCPDCHTQVLEGMRAGRPSLDTCMGCHSEAQTKSPEEEKIRQFAKDGREIPWKQVYRLPAHVYFSHRRHAGLAKIQCEVCHGAMAEMTAPPTAPLVVHTMGFCLDCHRRSNASVDCLACHR